MNPTHRTTRVPLLGFACSLLLAGACFARPAPAAADQTFPDPNTITLPINAWTPPLPLVFPPPLTLQLNGPITIGTPHHRTGVTFRFYASHPATFSCRVDGGPVGACTSPFTTARLPIGKHRIKIVAADSFGSWAPELKLFEIVRTRKDSRNS